MIRYSQRSSEMVLRNQSTANLTVADDARAFLAFACIDWYGNENRDTFIKALVYDAYVELSIL